MRLLFLIFIIIAQTGFSQNLVPNASFEEYGHHFLYGDVFPKLKSWKSPSKGSPDLLVESSTISYRYNNFCGYSKPYDGKAYVGIFTYGNYGTIKCFREYIMCKLLKKLEKNKKYCFSMYVSLGDKREYASSSLDIALVSNKVWANTMTVIPVTPSIIEIGGIVSDTANWVQVCTTYVAMGNEKNLIIGNFRDDEKTYSEKLKRKNPKYGREPYDNSYYYIDNVELYKISDTTQCQCIQEKQDTIAEIKETNDSNYYAQAREHSITLKNIFFETAKAELLPESYAELDKLTAYLQANPETKIEISGHTDNVGTVQYNQELSEARAKTVADYLAKQGINAQRISVYGYGNTHPINDNNTEEGRAKNRRVEFRIIAF